MIFGVDYASVDGNPAPDWKKVKETARFAYIRGAWGTYRDPVLARDRQHAIEAGLTVGAYLFLRFPELGHEAPSVQDQVAAFGAAYGPKARGELPPAVDVEFPGRGIVDTGMSRGSAMAMIREAVVRMTAAYGTVVIYTSARVWEEDLGNAPAEFGQSCPLWVKTPYAVRARQKPILSYEGGDLPLSVVPPPWHGSAWIQQYQGDALGYPGFAGTVDVNRFLVASGGKSGSVDNTDPRAGWIHNRLKGKTVRGYQDAKGLAPDGVIGPAAFAALCDETP